MLDVKPTRVIVGSMRLDPPFAATPGRARYLITLQCGCSRWEEYPVATVPGRVGEPAECYTRAHSKARLVMARLELAVYADRASRPACDISRLRLVAADAQPST